MRFGQLPFSVLESARCFFFVKLNEDVEIEETTAYFRSLYACGVIALNKFSRTKRSKPSSYLLAFLTNLLFDVIMLCIHYMSFTVALCWFSRSRAHAHCSNKMCAQRKMNIGYLLERRACKQCCRLESCILTRTGLLCQ